MKLCDINTLYINLDKRTDRRLHVENELKKINMENVTRFKGIEMKNGAIGCSMSHMKCVEHAKNNNWDCVFICEDDIEFTNPRLFTTQINKFLQSETNWDVVLVAGNNMIPYIPINDTCIKIFNCQTTTGYIVRREYYEKLIQNYKEGINKLLKEPENNDYKIDKYWFKLQRQDRWFLIIPLTVVQKEDYSDIEGKVTNFKKYMLDYNKAYKK